MPSSRAVLADISRLKLPHHVGHGSLDCNGRLKGSSAKAVVAEKVLPVVEVQPVEVATVVEKVEEVTSVVEAQEQVAPVVDAVADVVVPAADNAEAPAAEKKSKKKKVEKAESSAD